MIFIKISEGEKENDGESEYDQADIRFIQMNTGNWFPFVESNKSSQKNAHIYDYCANKIFSMGFIYVIKCETSVRMYQRKSVLVVSAHGNIFRLINNVLRLKSLAA